MIDKTTAAMNLALNCVATGTSYPAGYLEHLLVYINELEETIETLADADVMTAIEEARRYA